jgi:hypothetical protein
LLFKMPVRRSKPKSIVIHLPCLDRAVNIRTASDMLYALQHSCWPGRSFSYNPAVKAALAASTGELALAKALVFFRYAAQEHGVLLNVVNVDTGSN